MDSYLTSGAGKQLSRMILTPNCKLTSILTHVSKAYRKILRLQNGFKRQGKLLTRLESNTYDKGNDIQGGIDIKYLEGDNMNNFPLHQENDL